MNGLLGPSLGATFLLGQAVPPSPSEVLEIAPGLASRLGLHAYAQEVRVPDQWQRMGLAVLGDGRDPTLLASLAATLEKPGEREEANPYLARSMALEPLDAKSFKKRL